MLCLSSKPSIRPYYGQGDQVSYVSHIVSAPSVHCVPIEPTVATLFHVTWTPGTSLAFPMLFLLPRWTCSSFFCSFPLVCLENFFPTSSAPVEKRHSWWFLTHLPTTLSTISPLTPVLYNLGQRLGILDFPIVCPACGLNPQWSWHRLLTKFNLSTDIRFTAWESRPPLLFTGLKMSHVICKCRASFQSSREQEKAAFICLNGDRPSLSRGRKTYTK